MDVVVVPLDGATVTSPSRCVGASCGISIRVPATTESTYWFDVRASDGVYQTPVQRCSLTLGCDRVGDACTL
jgi:hypothetical protein